MGYEGEGRVEAVSNPPDEGRERVLPFPMALDLAPLSRWPTRLSEATVAAVLAAPLPLGTSAKFARVPEHAPRTSIVVVTLDNLVFNRLCIESLLDTTQEASCEIIVVDNGSKDGSKEYLRHLVETNSHIRIIYNGTNMGFAASNNQALSQARGEHLVLLNNDTIVPPGWLEGLLRHLEDSRASCPRLGLVGPVTNRCGNEAQIETSYRTYGELLAFAAQRAATHSGERTELRVATMFCAAMRRAVFEEVGPLDERFEIGLFEDDDYSMRMRAAGYNVACAEDVFVHHFGQASIGKLAGEGRYGSLFHANRRRWEEKWQQAWQPYSMRSNPSYDGAIARIRAFVPQVLPPGAALLVVSKGDESLLDLPGIRAAHFPQDRDGGYCGYNPADGRDAVAQLEDLKSRGAQYLLIPATTVWWLDYYTDLREYLQRCCTLVHQDAGTLLISLEVVKDERK